MRRGNEDKNAFLDVIVKTSNPTLIPHSQEMCAFANQRTSSKAVVGALSPQSKAKIPL